MYVDIQLVDPAIWPNSKRSSFYDLAMLQIRTKPLTTLDEWCESITYKGVILFYASLLVLLDKEANNMNSYGKYLR